MKPLGKDADLGTQVRLKSQHPFRNFFGLSVSAFPIPRRVSLRRVTTDDR